MQALETATRNPALLLGLSKTWGRVEAAYAANLDLLSADPLSDIANTTMANTTKINSVVVNGNLLDRKQPDQHLEKQRHTALEADHQNDEASLASRLSDQAVAVEPLERRRGRAPGRGKVMCQKLTSGLLNSRPTYILPSRSRRAETTRVSMERFVFSFTNKRVWPAQTISSRTRRAPCWLIERVMPLTQNFSPISCSPCTTTGTARATRRVRRRSR